MYTRVRALIVLPRRKTHRRTRAHVQVREYKHAQTHALSRTRAGAHTHETVFCDQKPIRTHCARLLVSSKMSNPSSSTCQVQNRYSVDRKDAEDWRRILPDPSASSPCFLFTTLYMIGIARTPALHQICPTDLHHDSPPACGVFVAHGPTCLESGSISEQDYKTDLKQNLRSICGSCALQAACHPPQDLQTAAGRAEAVSTRD